MLIELMTCIVAISLVPAEARAQDRPDCPGKIICPLTGDLVCKDRCPLGVNEAARTLVCCATDAPEVAPGMVSGQDQAGPISLRDSLEPLIDHFNSGQGKPRFVALVSSTCPACVFGAKAVRDSVLNAYPDADIQVSIVWIDMLPSDNEKAAAKSSAIFDDPRVTQFHDPDRKSGYAIAKDLLYENAGPAWDIYLYYDKDARWTDAPPKPIEYVHQLSGGRRADPARFRPGQQLIDALRESTSKILSAEKPATDGTLKDGPAPVATNDRTMLQINGMMCQGCVDSATKAIAALDGVSDVEVNFLSKLAWVVLDSPNAVSDNALVDAVKKAGFDAAIVSTQTNRGGAATRRAGASSRPAARLNATCPISGALLDADAPTFSYQGRTIGICCAGCEKAFLSWPKEERDAYLLENRQPVNLQFLSFPSCPNTPELRERLGKALAELGIDLEVTEVNLLELAKDDPRLCYGAPTILINGSDLLGQDPAKRPGLCCRIYADGGLPSLDELLQRLQDCCSTADDK
jgi:copper chaperone CopZ